MSDPPPKKVGSLRDRIAAFEKGGAAAPTGPAPPAARPKPAGGVSWKPRPRSPPPTSIEQTPDVSKPVGMSAADAKASIGQGGSLKERMAALQGLHAFGGAPAPPPKPATEKPKWKPPPVISPPPISDDENDEVHKPAAATEAEPDVPEPKPAEEGERTEQQDEGDAKPDPREEERQRRAAIAARMARLGGARVVVAPPVFGRKPDIKKSQARKAEEEADNETHEKDVGPPTEHPVTSPPETTSIASQKSDATPDYFESKETGHLSPDAALSPTIRSPAMPVPAGPRRAAPPRKRSAKSPSPAPATVLQEGATCESPSPLPDVSPTAPEVQIPSAVQVDSIGPHGDREPEVAGSRVEAMLENLHIHDPEVAEETEEASADTSPEVTAGPTTEHSEEEALAVQEDEVHTSPVAAHDTATAAEVQEEAVERTTVATDEHHPEVEEPMQVEQAEEKTKEETEEEEAARRKRIAERLAKAGGVNPLGGAVYGGPHSPVSPNHDPVSVERRQSLRKDSHGSVASEHPGSPLGTTFPVPEVPRRQGSLHSIHSQASVEHPTRRASQDERRHSVEPVPVPVRPAADEIVEEPEPHDYHEAVPEEHKLAEESYLPEESYLQEEAGDEHEPIRYDEQIPIEEEHDVQDEEEDILPPPPPSWRHPSLHEVLPPSSSPSERLPVSPPLPPTPQPEEIERQFPRREPVKRLSAPPVAPPRPPPPPPAVDVPDEEQEQEEEEPEELPPPVHREFRPPVRPPVEQEEADEEDYTPEPAHIVDDHQQPISLSSASRENYGDDTYTEEAYGEPEYEGREQDVIEDDGSIEALMYSPVDTETPVYVPQEEDPDQDVEVPQEEEEEEGPPPPPRRPPVPVAPSIVAPPPAPPARRTSVEQRATLAKLAPIVAVAPAGDEQEVIDDSDGDPIDPGFYSPSKSPRMQSLPLPISPPPAKEPEPQAQTEAGDDDQEDPEQARRRTIADRMAKLGGIRFGAPPPPPPTRRPQPPPEAQENEEGAAHEQEAQAQEAPDEEETEFARKQRIAARIAGMGGMRFGMLPGAPPAPRPQARPPSPSSQAREYPISHTVPQRVPPAVPPPAPESSDDEGERIEAEMSEAEEVTYEDAQEPEEEAPPPIPSREGRPVPHAETRRPSVPQMSRPPVPQIPSAHPKRTSLGSGGETSSASDFTYPPPPPARRPSIPTYDTQNDFVLVGNANEAVEEVASPPPRMDSLKKTHQHPSARTATLPPPLSASPLAESGVPNVDFGGETDLSLSSQWAEDPSVPPPPPTKGEFVQPSTTRPDVQLSADQLIMQWGRVGVQIHETASVLFDKSKKALVGDGSYLGFITAVLSQVPNASHPAPPFDNLGYLIYMQTGGSVQRRITDVMPGDLIVIHEAKFKGHKGLQSYTQTAGIGEPLYAIISDYEQKKSKVRVFQANQHVGQQTVESVSYRLEDLKSGSIKVFRVLEA